MPWYLAIDFGTTATTAAMALDDRVVLVEIDGASSLPSVVHLAEDGTLVVGAAAARQGALAPDRFERAVKRALGHEILILGGQPVPVIDAVAAILRRARDEALRLRGGEPPAAVCLTYPVRWGAERQRSLRDAARAAGLGEVELLPEPEAAAIHFARRQAETPGRAGPGSAAAEGGLVAVYDLGGGTFDTTVLRRSGRRYELVGPPGGIDRFGGEDVDERVHRHVGELLAADAPAAWESLRYSRERSWRKAAADLREDARRAKEELSFHTSTSIYVGAPVDAQLPLARETLESLVADDVARTVEELGRTLDAAGVGPRDLEAVYLVGGASRMPLVSRLVERRLQRTPDTLDDPKTVVAAGAATALALGEGSITGVEAADPGTAGEREPAGMHGAPTPGAAAPIAAVSGSSSPSRPSAPPPLPPPTSSDVATPTPTASAPPPGEARSRRRPLLVSAAVFVLLALGAGAALGLRSTGDPLLVSSPNDARGAVIRIDTANVEGAPGHEELFDSGGSGFFIDPSGLALTNAHVVVGASSLEVFVGEEDRSRTARVLGYSECADVAVLQVEGDDVPYLDWHEGEVTEGLGVWAAGFPERSDASIDYRLTQGIVANGTGSGETPWASVRHEIEHDAMIAPGSSGGPLVTEQGRVVGINYAIGEGSGTEQFAIGRDEIEPLLDPLADGESVDALGINGLALEEASEASAVVDGPGIYVSAVESGSVADEAGVQPGDLITHLERLPMGDGGTVASYCKVLRSNQSDDAMRIEVAREQDGTLVNFAGTLNARPLEEVARPEGTNVGASGGQPGETTTETGEGYDDYETVTDPTGQLQVDVPTTWTELEGGEAEVEELSFAWSLLAAPDITGWEAHEAPGIDLMVDRDIAATMNESTWLDEFGYRHLCASEERVDYDDGLYTGLADVYEGCGSADAVLVYFALVPPDRSHLVTMSIQILEERDWEAYEEILATWDVTLS